MVNSKSWWKEVQKREENDIFEMTNDIVNQQSTDTTIEEPDKKQEENHVNTTLYCQ